MGSVTITKVGDSSTPPPPVAATTPAPAPKRAAARSKTQRTYPRGILKIKPVSDPAKAPPLKKTAKRTVVQILTEKGAKRHRKTIRRKLKSMSNDQVKRLAEKHGLVKSKKVPPQLMRHMVEGGVIAGFISLD